LRESAAIQQLPEARTGACLPDQGQLARWLRSDEVVASSGAVRSWWNDASSGYDYLEAGGLWLAAACSPRSGLSCGEEQRESVARWLAARAAKHGAAGRDGDLYLFDSAVVLNGLVAHARATASVEHEGAIESLYRFVADSIARRRAVLPEPAGRERRWSTEFGAHQLKTVIALHRFADLTGSARPRALAGQVTDALLPLFDGRRFPVFEGAGFSYLHASLYALEGLAHLQSRGLGEHRPVLDAAARWLASEQRSDGGLLSFADASSCYGSARADAVAQAIRLWLLLDPEAWAENVDAAFSFLAGLQSQRGGIRYAPGSEDVNTWVSLFALQALEWRLGGAEGSELL
jgi:hypothetical protein